MPNWSGSMLTTKGQSLQAKVDAGETKLILTKMKVGTGVLPEGQSVANLTDLIAPLKNVGISAISAVDNITTVTGVMTNIGLTTGFYARELGLFATDTNGTEILYSIIFDSAPDYFPPEGGAVTVSEEFAYHIIVSNAANVSAVINQNGLVTAAILDAHNKDLQAHGLMTALHLRQNSTAYVVGDVKHSLTLPSWAYLECIQAGTTAATEPTWPSVGQEIADGTCKWLVRDIKSGSGLPIGTVMPFLATKPQPGWLALDTGAIVSRDTYKELWAWVQANAPLVTEAEWQAQAAVQESVGFYSTGDGSTTFRLPRIVDFVSGTDAGRPAGTWRPDDFKSHTHPIASPTGRNSNTGGTGAFVGTDVAFVSGATGGTETRPKSISMLYCVKAFDAVTNQGMIDIAALANEVKDKQNTIQYALIVDEKPALTNADTIAAGAWRTRVLNTVKYNLGNIVSLNNNQITIFQSGTYRISGKAPAAAVNVHKARIQNITTSTTLSTINPSMNGSDPSSSDGIVTTSECFGIVPITGPTVIELQQYVEKTQPGGGIAIAGTGLPEVFGIVEIWKVG